MTAGIAMAFKLIESAQARWRAFNAPSSHSSAQELSSRRASSSNDPTTNPTTSQEVTPTPHDTPFHRS